jgi:hypothetical protein
MHSQRTPSDARIERRMLSKDQQVPIDITPRAEMQHDKEMDLIKNWQD